MGKWLTWIDGGVGFPLVGFGAMSVAMKRCYLVVLSLAIVGMGAAIGQGRGVDPSLFVDTVGGSIPDAPDTGEGGWLEIQETPAPSPVVKPAAVPDAPAVDGSPPVPPVNAARRAKLNPNAKPKAPELPRKKKGSWLPWKKKKPVPTTIDPRLQPRISKPQARSSKGPGINAGASGLTPSELGRWKRDPRKAMAKARAERRMLLLWMTDSKRSGPSKSLAMEVFRHTHFLRMAKKSFELTRVDFGEYEIASHPYTKKLKKQLKVAGFPVLILFHPDGSEAWRYMGYRSNRYPEVIGQLAEAVNRFSLNERDHRKRLVAQGFRNWTNYKKVPMFAKALSVSREDKEVVLVNEYGEQFRYSVLKLSAADRDLLSEQFLKEPSG